MKTVPIQCYPFVFGNDGTGGLEGNAKLLGSRNSAVVNMALTDYEITLDDDYKAIVAILLSVYSSSPTITLELENNTFIDKWINNSWSTARLAGLIAFDLNVNKKQDDKYTVKYQARYSSNTSPTYWLKVYGIK